MSDIDAATEHAWEVAAGLGSTEGPHKQIVNQGRQLLGSEGRSSLDDADAALALYHGSTRYSFSSSATNQLFPDYEPTGLNVIRSCTDTMVANIVRNKVRPMFVTEKGDSELKEKALGMQRAVEAEFQRAQLWGQLGAQVCRHGCLFKAGGVKIIPDYANHRVGIELAYAHEFLVSPLEAQRGDPRQGWHVQPVPREQLLAQFSEDEAACKAIRAASPYTGYDSPRSYADSDQIADLVEVWEYWHLPSVYVDRSDPKAWGKGEDGERDYDIDPGHDGRHVICLESFTLQDDPWPFDYFPFAWFRPARAAVGFWSIGLPERLAPAQLLLNRMNDRIDQIIKMHAVPTLIVSKQAKINEAKWTNQHNKILTVNGSPQQAVYYLVPQSVPSELFRRVEDIIRWAEKETGISEMSMSARKPAGVDHAPGLQHLADTETIRHTVAFREWEDFFTSAARITVDCFRMLAEWDPKFEVTFADSKQLKHIKWKTVDISDERWHLTVWPTNLLPQTPGARMSKAMDMFNAGFWTREQTALALDYPDIEAISGDTTAALENIERMIEAAAKGEQVTPEPYMNLQLALTTTVNTINRMEADGEDPARVDRVRQVWEDVNELIQRMAPPPAMPPGGAPADMPPAPPPGPIQA